MPKDAANFRANPALTERPDRVTKARTRDAGTDFPALPVMPWNARLRQAW